MNIKRDVENKLKKYVDQIAKDYPGAPVIVIVGGSEEAGVSNVTTVSNAEEQGLRLRDIVGVLQTAILIEGWKHFNKW